METPDKTLRENLDRELKLRDWKITQLARAAGLSPSTLYPIWDDEHLAWPQPATLAKLAAGLGTTVSALLSTEDAGPTPQEALGVLTKLVAANSQTLRQESNDDPLVTRVRALSEASRRKLTGALEALEDADSDADRVDGLSKPGRVS